jgi:hypothetical protein
MSARAFQVGSSWIYADDSENLLTELDKNARLVSTLLSGGGIHRFSYLRSRLSKIHEFAETDTHFKRAMLNFACSRAMVRKLLCATKAGEWYASYFHPTLGDVVALASNATISQLQQGATVKFSDLSRKQFDGAKGSYYWAQGICEHLVWLGLAVHVDEFRIAIR